MVMNKALIKLLGVLVVFVIAFWLASLVQEEGAARNVIFTLGYPGVLIISIISGFNFFIPIPAVSFVPVFIEAGLNIWPIIFFIVLGTTIADSVAYIIGVTGREFFKSWTNKKLFIKLDVLRKRYYWSPVIVLFFFAAFVPFPNELLLVPLGFMGYKIRHVLIPYVAGNIVFTTLASLGITNLFNIL